MNTLIKVIVTIVISLFLCSCEFNFAVIDGNGNVVNDQRTLDQPFNAIEASTGLEVELMMDQNEKVVVIADENLLDIITTEIKDNTLHISAKQNIGHATSKKILVGVKDITSIQTRAGAYLWSKDTIEAKDLDITVSSGSHTSLKVAANSIQLSASSGGNLEVEGNANFLNAKASSGGHINADDLLVENIRAKASSGAVIKVIKTEQIAIEESSGGHVRTNQ